MPSAENSVIVNKPRSEVFDFLADPAENDMKWRPGVLDLTRASGSGLGAVYRQGVKGPMGRRIPADIEITVSAPTEPEAIEALARRGVKRVAVPVSSAAGLPAQVRTPDDVLRYGKTMIERFGE